MALKRFLPTDEWAGDLSAPDSSDSESGVDFIEPVSAPVQAEITKQQLLRPPVVNQTRPMEGYHTGVGPGPPPSPRGQQTGNAN